MASKSLAPLVPEVICAMVLSVSELLAVKS